MSMESNAALDKDQPEIAGQNCGCWCRKWRFWVLVLLLAIVASGGGAYWAFFTRVYNLPVCQSAMQTICADKQLQRALGQPINTVKCPSRSNVPNARIEEREIDVLWNIKGPNGRAKAHVHARLMAGKWEADVLEVTLADGKRVLLQAAGGTEADAPVFHATKPESKKSEKEAPAPDINLPVPPGDVPGKS